MSSKRTTRASKQRGDITLIDMSDDSNVWKADTTKNDNSKQPAAKKQEEGRTTRSTRRSSTTNTTNNNNTVQSINITARKRPPTSKKKKNNPTIRSDQTIIQALDEANYEAYVDPYRGIMPYFSVSFPSNDNNNNNNPSSSNNNNNDSNNSGNNNGNGNGGGGGNGGNNNEEKESPWIKCQDVLLLNNSNNTKKKKWNFNNPNDEEDDEVIDVDEDDSKSAKQKSSGEEETALLVQCECTTVDTWATDELEVYTKKLAAKNKKSNNTRGKKRKSDGQFLSGSDDAKSGDDTGDDTNDVIMEDSKSKQQKEKKEPLLICGDRKRDVRNGNATILHCCDYNPYCLASLGGIVDQYRQSAAQIRYAIISTNTSSKKKKPSPSDISKQIHDNLSNKLQNTTFPLQQNKWNGNKLKEEKRLDNGLRTAIFVDSDVITNHVSSYICENDVNVEAKEFVGRIKSCHQPLLFKPDQSSTLSQSSTDNGNVELSQPSGLRNLGATCYLNSQLQCLAQNLGFIHGLFSWKKPTNTGGSNGSKRMTEVLSHMQSILARMRYGPDRVLCTNEFASALSLENNEMQDPNEFARLLFDRMAESFRRSAEISSSTNGSLEQRGLGELLPSVFGGTTQYVTSCSVCGTESTRSEDYMELLIPIVDVEVEGMKKAGSKLKKDRGKPTAPDVDVQHCVDTYLFPESLDGDNQYECSQCRKKVDATRRMRFAKLPPVLNLQLARYVFDRETLSKRKLTTKVLLPKSLEIPSTATTKQNEHSRYILCAVQNHLGTSAHGGHYVADVMDWTTGVWYEFNDEEVTRLGGGPVSSFDPSKTKKGQEPKQPGNGRKANGSQDAYNLFYVEQTYLARHAKSELSQFMNNESPSNDDSILSSIKLQRNERFKVEVDQMHRQLLRGRRLTARKDMIVDKLFQPTRSTESKVWVDSNFLRRFLSCEDDLEDLFRNAIESNTLYKRESFLCEHSQGLNPRKARQGKLLSMEMYDALESILQHEYEMFLDDRSADTKLARHLTLMDHKFIDGDNLTCQECGVSYQQETAKKYELFDTLISINDGLLPGKNDISTVDNTEESPDVYVISRTWVNSFREYMKKKVREMKTPPVRGAEEVINSLCGGIDVVDLKEVTGEGKIDGYKSTDNSVDLTADTVDPSKKEEERRDRDPFKGEEDPTWKVTCDHGKCSVMHNGQKRRLVTGDMWRNISKAFPAVSHRYEHPRDDATGNCELCLLEKEEGKLFPQKIVEWKDNILQSETLNELLERGSTSPNSYPSAVDIALLHNSEEPMSCRVLHGVDVQRWRNCVDVASKFTKKKAKASRHRLNELMFISSNSSSLGREFRFRPLTCEHSRAVTDIPREEEVPSWLQKLNESGLELLFDQEYEELVQSISTLESILHYDGSANFPSAPTICLRVEESKSSTNITPRICHRGCKFSLFNDEILEEGKIVPKPKQVKRPAAKKEPVEEAPKGPLCKIHIHEIDSGSDVVVATSLIMLDISSDQETQQTSSNGRPQRSRKARGDKGSFPTHELEMALDGNLAHFRLLLHQSKGKKLFDQRLFLISPGSSVEAQELLPGESNLKTMQELASSGSSKGEASTTAADCELHMALTYGSSDSTSDTTKPNSRKRVSRQEEKAEEEVLLVTLSDIACGGWKTADGNDVVVGGKKTKRRRQERGFQGTFLQSTELTPPSQDDGSAAKDAEDEDDDVVIIDNEESQVSVDVVKPAAEETVEALLSSGNCSLATQPDDDDRPTTQQFDDSQVTTYESQPITQQFDDTQAEETESKKPKNTKALKLRAKDMPCAGCDGPLDDNFLVCAGCKLLFFCTKCEEDKYPAHCATCPATKENHSPPVA